MNPRLLLHEVVHTNHKGELFGKPIRDGTRRDKMQGYPSISDALYSVQVFYWR